MRARICGGVHRLRLNEWRWKAVEMFLCFAVQLLKCATLLLASHHHKEFSKGRARQLNSPRVIFYTGKCLPKRQQANSIMQQQTRLVAAAEAGRVGSVRSLLQAGANADTPDAVQHCML